MVDVLTDGAGAPRRSRGKMIGAVAGVAALVAAGTFAVVRVTGNDTAGGAASPEEVGTALTEALSNEDLLGVIDLLLPGERDTFRDPLVDFVEHLRRLEVLSGEADLAKLGGIDIEFTDVEVDLRETDVADIATIAMSGSSTVSVDGEAIPLGDLLLDEVFDGERPDMDMAPDTAEFVDTELTVVERDGRWYLSAFYSIAEQLRIDAGAGEIPADGVRLNGADEPDGAVDNVLAAVSDLDLGDLIGALDPTEFEALQRYAPLFLDDAQREIDEAGIDWELTDRTFEVSGDGSRRSVTVTGFRFTASIEDTDDVAVTFADGCLEGDVAGTEVSYCTTDRDASVDDALRDSGLLDTDVGDLIESLADAFADTEVPGISVHEVDGEWYVSPLRTGWDMIDAVLGALDADELRDIVRRSRELGDDVGGAIDDVLGGDIGLGDSGVDPIDDESGDGSGDGSDAGTDALSECYLAGDAAAALACFEAGIASGTIDPDFVPAQYRFAECGVAEAYWSDIYSMSDAEFVALAEGASPCFRDLVSSGAIDAWMVPGELLTPECLEGKNWYTNFDEGYSERFFECTSAATAALDS
jgi:hypothetical protein